MSDENVRISIDVSFGTFVKMEDRTTRERISKAKLIRGLISNWLEEGESKE